MTESRCAGRHRLLFYLETLLKQVSKIMELKAAFFQKVLFVFQISKSPKWKYSEKRSWAWNLKLLFTVIGEKFKFQVQDSFLEYFHFGDLEIWKTNRTLWKKATLTWYLKFEFYRQKIHFKLGYFKLEIWKNLVQIDWKKSKNW